MADREHLKQLTRELMDQGKLIEAGWVSLRLAAIPLDAPAIQLEEMRKAYFAGAQHLHASLMTGLEEGTEPTDADMRRMSLIAAELEEFGNQLSADLPTHGRACWLANPSCSAGPWSGPCSTAPKRRRGGC